jgi:hypothetical protein
MQHRIHAGNGRRVGRRARSNRARPRCCVLAPTLPPISTPSRQRIDELLWPWPLAVARRADRRSRPDHSIGLIPPRNCIPAGSEGRRPLLRCRTAPKADQIARGGPSRVRPDAARFAQYPVRPTWESPGNGAFLRFCAMRMRREASRVSFLLCPFCVRGELLTRATLPRRWQARLRCFA